MKKAFSSHLSLSLSVHAADVTVAGGGVHADASRDADARHVGGRRHEAGARQAVGSATPVSGQDGLSLTLSISLFLPEFSKW